MAAGKKILSHIALLFFTALLLFLAVDKHHAANWKKNLVSNGSEFCIDTDDIDQDTIDLITHSNPAWSLSALVCRKFSSDNILYYRCGIKKLPEPRLYILFRCIKMHTA